MLVEDFLLRFQISSMVETERLAEKSGVAHEWSDVINARDDVTGRKADEHEWRSSCSSDTLVKYVREDYTANRTSIPDDVTIENLARCLDSPQRWREVAASLNVNLESSTVTSPGTRHLVEAFASRCAECDWQRFASVLRQLGEQESADIVQEWLNTETQVKQLHSQFNFSTSE